jgi:hypothetical protein
MCYHGTADSKLFETWFEKCFCPEVRGNICVMDNATIHRKEKLKNIAEKFYIYLLIFGMLFITVFKLIDYTLRVRTKGLYRLKFSSWYRLKLNEEKRVKIATAE